MTTTADDHFPAPPTVSQYKIERFGFAHLGGARLWFLR